MQINWAVDCIGTYYAGWQREQLAAAAAAQCNRPLGRQGLRSPAYWAFLSGATPSWFNDSIHQPQRRNNPLSRQPSAKLSRPCLQSAEALLDRWPLAWGDKFKNRPASAATNFAQALGSRCSEAAGCGKQHVRYRMLPLRAPLEWLHQTSWRRGGAAGGGAAARGAKVRRSILATPRRGPGMPRTRLLTNLSLSSASMGSSAPCA